MMRTLDVDSTVSIRLLSLLCHYYGALTEARMRLSARVYETAYLHCVRLPVLEVTERHS